MEIWVASDSTPGICSLGLSWIQGVSTDALCLIATVRLNRAKPSGSEILGTESCRGCSSQMAAGLLRGHKCPPLSPVAPAFPRGATAPAQLPLDLSCLSGHVLCLAAQLHPEPVILTPSHRTPTALQAAALPEGVRCQKSGRCSGLARYHLPRRHLGPRRALPGEQENPMRTDIAARRQPQMQRAR